MMPMSGRAREGLAILAAGIALGVAADVLAHTMSERLNVAVALVWRDSPTLFALNLLGMAGLLTLASPRVVAVSHKRAGLADYAWGAGQLLAGVSFGGLPLLLSDIEWRSLPREGKVRVIGDA